MIGTVKAVANFAKVVRVIIRASVEKSTARFNRAGEEIMSELHLAQISSLDSRLVFGAGKDNFEKTREGTFVERDFDQAIFPACVAKSKKSADFEMNFRDRTEGAVVTVPHLLLVVGLFKELSGEII